MVLKGPQRIWWGKGMAHVAGGIVSSFEFCRNCSAVIAAQLLTVPAGKRRLQCRGIACCRIQDANLGGKERSQPRQVSQFAGQELWDDMGRPR